MSATCVTVRFFASLREAAGMESLRLGLDNATLAGVRERLAEVLTAAQLEPLCAQGVQVAVNQAIVQGEVRLASGDEVAFLPPVTGG